jgi:DENN (AEX-3) domain/uDENN domain
MYTIDLETNKLQKPELSHGEHFTFTLTDKDGKRVYGVCYRQLFRGEGRRYDINRRVKHCLCIISRQPYIALFKSALLQVHALSLLETTPGLGYLYLNALYEQSISGTGGLFAMGSIHLTVKKEFLPTLIHRNMSLVSRRYTGLHISSADVSVLPLVEALGVEKLLMVLSAALCERRILFIAEDNDRLSASVLATASLLYPFYWQHIFIPLLPSKLLDYVSSPIPYMIGIRKYLLPRIRGDALGDVLIVDCDSGDVRTVGNVEIKDFIGDSASTLKAASESFGKMRAGVATIFNSSNANTTDPTSESFTGPRDIVSAVVSDLRSVLSSKPGSLTGMLRTLPGSSKSAEETKDKWVLESERAVRDALIYFYTYLFASLDSFVNPSALTTGGDSAAAASSSRGVAREGEAFGQGDSRAAFNIKAFLTRRGQMGDSKRLLEFLSECTHSQLFERFCDERLARLKSNQTSSSSSSRKGGLSDEEEDVYESLCNELRGQPLTVANIKQVITTYSSADKVGSEFHHLTFQLTAGAISNAATVAVAAGGGSGKSQYSQVVDRICAEASNNEAFLKIMRTIAMRLQSGKAASARGQAGSNAVRALWTRVRLILLVGLHPLDTYSHACE